MKPKNRRSKAWATRALYTICRNNGVYNVCCEIPLRNIEDLAHLRGGSNDVCWYTIMINLPFQYRNPYL